MNGHCLLWMPPVADAAESKFLDTSPLIILYETILEAQHKTDNTKDANVLTRKRNSVNQDGDSEK